MGSCPGSSHHRPPLSQSRHPSGANPARESGTSIRHSDCPSLFNAGSSSQLARPRRAPPCAPLPTQRHFGRSASWPPLGRKLKGIELYNAYVMTLGSRHSQEESSQPSAVVAYMHNKLTQKITFSCMSQLVWCAGTGNAPCRSRLGLASQRPVSIPDDLPLHARIEGYRRQPPNARA